MTREQTPENDRAPERPETQDAAEDTAEVRLEAPQAPWTIQLRPDGSIAVVIREDDAEEAHVVKSTRVVRLLRKLVELAREA